MKEFGRRREQRRWAALISNMLPRTVVYLLQRTCSVNNGDAAPTLAWNLPNTCIFQSDIVGFTSLTQRIAPHQLVAGPQRILPVTSSSTF